jgi:hypothetical protein
MANEQRQGKLENCPKCHKPLALLPSELYENPEDVDPGVIEDTAGQKDASFALVDWAGNYKCPECRKTSRAELPQ